MHFTEYWCRFTYWFLERRIRILTFISLEENDCMRFRPCLALRRPLSSLDDKVVSRNVHFIIFLCLFFPSHASSVSGSMVTWNIIYSMDRHEILYRHSLSHQLRWSSVSLKPAGFSSSPPRGRRLYLKWHVSTTIGWRALNFGKHMHVPP